MLILRILISTGLKGPDEMKLNERIEFKGCYIQKEKAPDNPKFFAYFYWPTSQGTTRPVDARWNEYLQQSKDGCEMNFPERESCAGCGTTARVLYQDHITPGFHSGQFWCAGCGGRQVRGGAKQVPVRTFKPGDKVVYHHGGMQIKTVVKHIRRDGSIHIAQGYGGSNVYASADSLTAVL